MSPRQGPALGDRVIYVDEQGREFAAIVASVVEDNSRTSVVNLGAYDHDGTTFHVQAVPFDPEYGMADDPYCLGAIRPKSASDRRGTCHWPPESR